MHNERYPCTVVQSKLLARLSVILVVAACLGPAGPAAGQSEPPGVPSVLLASRDRSLRVSWFDVPGADFYDVRWKSGSQGYGTSRLTQDLEDSQYTIPGLTNGREYTVQVRASNSAGNSAWSAEETATPAELVDPPVLRLTSGNRSITVAWDAVAGAVSYTLFWQEEDDMSNSDTISGITSTSYTIDDLDPGRYIVTVWSRNAQNTLGVGSTTVIAQVGALGPGTLELCGARVGTPQSRRRDAEVDVCWETGGVIPMGSDVVIEARERYWWDDAQPFRGWKEIARGDDFTACTGSSTCVQYTRAELYRGFAFEMELRIRRGGSVLATSPGLKAQAPNSNANTLRAHVSEAVEEDTGYPIDAPDGPFVVEVDFADPHLDALLPELVQGLEPADFEITNGTVTDVQVWDDDGTYKVSVRPTTLSTPVTIRLPANRVKGVGEGISASGGNNYTRDNEASNTVVQETSGAEDAVLTAEFENVPAAHNRTNWFWLRLRFNESPNISYRTLENRALTATGGTVKRASRVNRRYNDLWNIAVRPSSDAPVTLTLASSGDCGQRTAVCMADGRVLSNSPTVTVQGPGGDGNLVGPDAGKAAPAVNRPPRAVGTIPPQALGVEDAELTLDVAPYFADEDAAGLTFSAESLDPATVAVSLAGSLLAMTAAGPGTSLVTVTARDAGGLTAEQAFAVRVADRWGRAATGDALAALGRSYLSSVRSTLGRRVDSRSPAAAVTVAGQRIPLDRTTAQEVGVSLVSRLFPQAGAPGGPGFQHSGAGHVAPGALAFGTPGAGSPAMVSLPGRSLRHRGSMASGHLPVASPNGFGRLGLFGGGASQAWRSTNVVLPLGGQADTATAASPGRRWTVWGQGDVQTFRAGATGGASSTSTYDGDLQTAYVGLDARLNDQWMAGVSLARSFGSGTWSSGRSRGRLSTALTALHPYVQWSRGGTTVWALGGIGRGTAENVRLVADGGMETSGLGLGLGLVEARREVAVVGGGVRLGLRGELSWAQLTTDAGGETLHDLQAGVRRTRAGFEASREWSWPGGARLEPFGRLSVRQDGGAGQTGVGLEMESGARLTAGLVRVEAQGRMLALHTASHYAERGGSVTLSVGEGTERPGLTLWLAPRWGAAQGADMLWQEQLQRPFGGTSGADARTVDARVSYGWRLPWRLLVSPFGGYGTGWGRRRLQLGATLGSLDDGGATASPLQVELSGERHLRRQGAADHRVTLLGVLTFGVRRASAAGLSSVP